MAPKGAGDPCCVMMVKWSSFACAGFMCVCVCVWICVCVFDYQLQHSFEGYNWDYIFVLFMF